MKPVNNPNHLSPDMCKIKASSLPSILDSENEQEDELKEGSENVKTPTSTASSGRYSVKLKNWKIPKFLRKSENKDLDKKEDNGNSSNCEDCVSNSTGYQQVPTIIETSSVKKNELDSWSVSQLGGEDKHSSLYLDEQKDTIDVKSYISQSRSDIGQYDYSVGDFSHFIRSGSYRSNYGRMPHEFSFLSRAGSNRSRRGKSPNMDFPPAERARSATVAVASIDRPKKTLEVPHRLSTILVDDRLSTAHSVNSRKDSGIKSTSRRSSIQQVNLPNLN